MKLAGMPFVSLIGLILDFRSPLGCSGQNANNLSRQIQDEGCARRNIEI